MIETFLQNDFGWIPQGPTSPNRSNVMTHQASLKFICNFFSVFHQINMDDQGFVFVEWTLEPLAIL